MAASMKRGLKAHLFSSFLLETGSLNEKRIERGRFAEWSLLEKTVSLNEKRIESGKLEEFRRYLRLGLNEKRIERLG